MENQLILSLFDKVVLQAAIHPSPNSWLGNIFDIQSIKNHIIHIIPIIRTRIANIRIRIANIRIRIANIRIRIANISIRIVNISIRIADISIRIADISIRIANISIRIADISIRIFNILILILSIPEPIRIKKGYNPAVIQQNSNLQIIGVQL